MRNIFCKYCGERIDEDSVYCPHCGKQLSIRGKESESVDNTILEPEKNQPPRVKDTSEDKIDSNRTESTFKTHKNLYVICAGIAILAIVCWVISVSIRSNDSSSVETIDKVSVNLSLACQGYDRLYSFHEGLARVRKDNKYGFIDKLGMEVIPCKYEDADDFQDELAIVTIGGKDGAINKKGKTIIPFKYNHLSMKRNGTITAIINDNCGILDKKGKVIVPLEYEHCGEFREGRAAVRKNGKYGFVDESGSVVIPCEYDDVLVYEDFFSEGLVGVKKDGKWGYIDINGRVAIPFNDGLGGYAFSEGVTTIIKTIVLEYDKVLGLPYKWDMKMAYIDKKGNRLTDYTDLSLQGFYNGYATVIDNTTHYIGLINRHFEYVIPLGKYTFFRSLGDGLIIVKNGYKYGVYNDIIDQETIPCIYDDIEFGGISEGLMYAKKDGKYGYITADNKVIIQFVYDDADGFSEGFGVVERYGKYGYVDRYGNDTFSMR